MDRYQNNNFYEAFKKILFIAWPGIVLTLVAVVAFWSTLILHQRTFFLFPDNVDQFYAWYQKLSVSLHNGVLPIWDANVFSGHSFVGELQSGVFYPINLIWVTLFGSVHGISVRALDWLVAIHFLIASLGMYFATRSLGLSKYGALASALIFAYGEPFAQRSVAQTVVFFGFSYIPWALFLFNQWLVKHKKTYLVVCGIVLGLSILSGHIEPFFFACLALLLLLLTRTEQTANNFILYVKSTCKKLLQLVLAIGIAILIALPQLVLAMQYLTQSYRFVNESQPIGFGQRLSFTVYTSAYNYSPSSLLSFLDPSKYTAADGNGLYIGLLGLAILLLVLLVMHKTFYRHLVWQNYRPFLLITMAVAALFMFGYWTFIPAVANYVPLLSQVRELGRYSILIQLCLAIMVGISIEVAAKSIRPYLNSSKKRKIILAIALFLFVNAIYLYLVAQRHGNLINSDFAYENGVIALCVLSILFLSKRSIPIIISGLIVTAVLQPMWFVPTIASNASNYPPTYYKKTPSIIFLEKYYGEARVLIDGNALPPNIGDVYSIQTVLGHDATIPINLYKFLNEPDPTNQNGEHLNLLNVRFIVSSNPNLPLHKVMFDNIRKIYIYSRSSYLPRAFFASQVNQCELKIKGCTPIRITQYSDNSITLHYSDKQSQTLVLSEVNYSGWKAYVDGRSVPIKSYTAPGLNARLLRSIPVPAGRHTVVFQYKPFDI